MARAPFDTVADASTRTQIVFLYQGLSRSSVRAKRRGVFRDCRKERI